MDKKIYNLHNVSDYNIFNGKYFIYDNNTIFFEMNYINNIDKRMITIDSRLLINDSTVKNNYLPLCYMGNLINNSYLIWRTDFRVEYSKLKIFRFTTEENIFTNKEEHDIINKSMIVMTDIYYLIKNKKLI